MNRKTLLVAQVKAELWAARIARKHAMKFMKKELNNAQAVNQTAQVQTIQPNNQPVPNEQPYNA